MRESANIVEERQRGMMRKERKRECETKYGGVSFYEFLFPSLPSLK